MYTPSKIAKMLKDTFTSSKNNDSVESKETATNVSLEWSDNKDMINIKKTEYESLQMDIYNKTEIIKRLKNRNEDNKSLITEYENAFKLISKNKEIVQTSNLLDEVERLRSNENRLKAHIQALKRDLIICEEKAENECMYKDQYIDTLKNEIDDLKSVIKKQSSRIQDVEFSNNELKITIQKKCENIVELTAICNELMKEWS